MAADKEKTTKGDLGLLEEDDEFEEFPAEGKIYYICFFYPHHVLLQISMLCKKTRMKLTCGKTIGMMIMLKTTSTCN